MANTVVLEPLSAMSASPALQCGLAHLTRNERRIFDALYAALGNWLTSTEVARRSVGWPTTSLKSHICHMRVKLRESGWEIQSRYGVYRLVRSDA